MKLSPGALLTLSVSFLAVVSLHPAQAAGVAAMKEQPFHSDSLAKPLVYTELIDVAPPVWKVVTGSATLTLDKSKIAAFVDLPAAIPAEIQTEAQFKEVRDKLTELQAFTKKYPKCEPTLRPYVEAFAGHVKTFDSGMVRHEGRWITKAQWAAVEKKQEEQKAAEKAKWEAEKEERHLAQKKWDAFVASQEKKGLVYYDEQWIPVAEAARRDESKRADVEVVEAINSRSVANAIYSVIQVLDDGVLITVESGASRLGRIDSNVAWVTGVDIHVVAEGDQYSGNLFWCGTYSYLAKGGNTHTVNAYCPDKNLAFQMLTANGGEAAEAKGEAAEGDRPAAKPKPASKTPEIFADAKGCGSGFFIGSGGHLVTNEHVVHGASSVKVYYNGKLVIAEIVKTSESADLALLRIGQKPVGLPIMEAEAKTGSDVFAIGFPQPTIQGTAVKVTKGIISGAKGLGDDESCFQIDAALQPGNSGGPLCDPAGNVVGVAVATLNPEFTGNIPQNVNYAIKASELRAFLRSTSISFESGKAGGGGTAGDAIEKATKATVLIIVK